MLLVLSSHNRTKPLTVAVVVVVIIAAVVVAIGLYHRRQCHTFTEHLKVLLLLSTVDSTKLRLIFCGMILFMKIEQLLLLSSTV